MHASLPPPLSMPRAWAECHAVKRGRARVCTLGKWKGGETRYLYCFLVSFSEGRSSCATGRARLCVRTTEKTVMQGHRTEKRGNGCGWVREGETLMRPHAAFLRTGTHTYTCRHGDHIAPSLSFPTSPSRARLPYMSSRPYVLLSLSSYLCLPLSRGGGKRRSIEERKRGNGGGEDEQLIEEGGSGGEKADKVHRCVCACACVGENGVSHALCRSIRAPCIMKEMPRRFTDARAPCGGGERP